MTKRSSKYQLSSYDLKSTAIYFCIVALTVIATNYDVVFEYVVNGNIDIGKVKQGILFVVVTTIGIIIKKFLQDYTQPTVK